MKKEKKLIEIPVSKEIRNWFNQQQKLTGQTDDEILQMLLENYQKHES